MEISASTHLPIRRLSKMAEDDDFVTVVKSQFDRLRQHCERCPDFDKQLQDLSDAHTAFTPYGRPSGEPSKKRKTLHGLKASQPSHSSQQPEPQLPSRPSQQPEPQLPSRPSQEPESQLPFGSSNTSKVKKPKRANTKGPRKNKAAGWFLRNIPKATEWRKRQTELKLYTVEQYEQTIRAFTDRTNIIVEREPYRGDGLSEHEFVALAESFALLTSNSLTNAKLQRSFATFQALILLSYCQVLRKRGVSYETVDRIIENVTGREYDRRRLLDSAVWINGVIVKLVSLGWTIYRATELFFIGVFSKLPACEDELTSFLDALSITYLTQIPTDENSRSILEYLETDEFVKYHYSDCLRPEYTIPGLIASLLDTCKKNGQQNFVWILVK